MSQVKNSEAVVLVANLQKCLKKYSVEELNDALLKFFAKKEDNAEEIDFVLQTIAEDYEISKRTLIRSTAYSTREPKEIAFCILHLNLGLSLRHISSRVFFYKSPNSVASVIRRFHSMDKNNEDDERFLMNYEKYRIKLAEHLIK